MVVVVVIEAVAVVAVAKLVLKHWAGAAAAYFGIQHHIASVRLGYQVVH